MKLLLDDKQHRGHNLNANEACIFAAILKCTRAGRGWYGNYRVLAAAMPFVMSHETARRAVQKLLNLGLIERREEKLFTLTQIVTDDAQNVTELTQNVTSDAQNVPPLNNPPIMDFWFLFSAPKEMLNRENACRRLWESQTFSRAKKKAIMKELTDHQMNGTLTEERNPFVYLRPLKFRL